MDVTIPTNRVPPLPAGHFFRVTTKEGRWEIEVPYVQIRRKGLLGSKVVMEQKIDTGYPHYRLHEDNVLSAMVYAEKNFTAERNKLDDKTRLLGDYPPKKIIK